MEVKKTVQKIETMTLKLVIVHLLFLFFAQFLHQADEVKPYLSKTVLYEGVYNQYSEKSWKH